MFTSVPRTLGETSGFDQPKVYEPFAEKLRFAATRNAYKKIKPCQSLEWEEPKNPGLAGGWVINDEPASQAWCDDKSNASTGQATSGPSRICLSEIAGG
jgi:hypothetical protein